MNTITSTRVCHAMGILSLTVGLVAAGSAQAQLALPGSKPAAAAPAPAPAPAPAAPAAAPAAPAPAAPAQAPQAKPAVSKQAKPAAAPAQARPATAAVQRAKNLEEVAASLAAKLADPATEDSVWMQAVTFSDQELSKRRALTITSSQQVTIVAKSASKALGTVLGAIVSGGRTQITADQVAAQGTMASSISIEGADDRTIQAAVAYARARGEKIHMQIGVPNAARAQAVRNLVAPDAVIVKLDVQANNQNRITWNMAMPYQREAMSWVRPTVATAAASPAAPSSQPATVQPQAAPSSLVAQLQACTTDNPGAFLDKVKRDLCESSLCSKNPSLAGEAPCVRWKEIQERNAANQRN